MAATLANERSMHMHATLMKPIRLALLVIFVGHLFLLWTLVDRRADARQFGLNL